MSVGIGIISQSGAGTLLASTSSATISPVISSNSVNGLLCVMVAYVTGQDCTLAKDHGGWSILDAVYNSGSSFGLLLAAKVLNVRGSYTDVGIELPGLAAFTAQTYVYGKLGFSANGSYGHFQFDVGNAVGSRAGVTVTASGTGNSAPQILPGASQFLDLIAVGYNNAGTTTTVGTYSGFTEVFDTGQVSPPHGISLNSTSANVVPIQSNQLRPSISAALAVAKTNRACVRACVPITGNIMTAASRRYINRRRIGG